MTQIVNTETGKQTVHTDINSKLWKGLGDTCHVDMVQNHTFCLLNITD